MNAADTIKHEEHVKIREKMYRLMISQLYYDGHQQIANVLSVAACMTKPCPPSDRCFHVIKNGLTQLPEHGHDPLFPGTPISTDQKLSLGSGLDMELNNDIDPGSPEPWMYETAYVTSHKAACRAGAFSPDGTLVATGSADASIKILDVERMLAKSSPDSKPGTSMIEILGAHPVIRTYYDHIEEITCLEFHPTAPILVSGSRDCTIKIFNYSKPVVRKAFRILTDVKPIKCFSLHPTGDYLVVGTDDTTIRMYDIQTSQCFVSSMPQHQHKSGVNSIMYSPDCKLFVSGGRDGCIKVWDAVTNRMINHFDYAHDGAEVSSVKFTRNGKYLLSVAKDSIIKLWELATTRCLLAYTGAGTAGDQRHEVPAVFNHTEDFIMFPDQATSSLCSWNARTGARQRLMALSHNGLVRMLCHSPSTPAFVTGSDDFRARYWTRRFTH